MTALPIHRCECEKCRSRAPHPERALHRQIDLLASRLDEQQRRWFVALEALRAGRGEQQLLAQVTGLDRHTIERGRRELVAGLKDRPADRIRLPGGGVRPPGCATRRCSERSMRWSPRKRREIRWDGVLQQSAVPSRT